MSEPLPDRLGTERGEQRRHHRARFNAPSTATCSSGTRPEQRVDAVAGLHTERAQHVREAVRERVELAIGEVAARHRGVPRQRMAT